MFPVFPLIEVRVHEHRPNSGRRFYTGLFEALVQVMGTAKGYLFHHGPRVALTADRIAEQMGLSIEERSEIFLAAVLQDLGMIGLVEDAWENPVPILPESQRARVVEHPERSASSVRAIPHIGRVGELVRHHHEWWDGSGYPDRLTGDAIPRGARVLRIADTVVALASDRPQRPALELEGITQVVQEGSGAEFGPAEAEAFLTLAREGRTREFHPSVFHRSTLDAVTNLIPDEISPLSTMEFLDIIASLIDAKDPYTAGHSRRVGRLAAAVARRIGLDEGGRDTTWASGYLHDLGKVGVPLAVLAKKGALDADERRAVQCHAEDGAEILASIPALQHLSTGVRYHHERWDGGGYPEGLSGTRIPTVARILAVCDAYDAMTSQRSYRASRTHDEAMAVIETDTGRHFCPDVAAVFRGLPNSVFEDLWRPEKTLRHWLVRPLVEWRSGAVGRRRL